MTRRLYTLNSAITYYTDVGPVEERIGLILSLMDVAQSSFFACSVHFSMSRHLPSNGVEMSYACFLACASFFLFVPSPQATAFLAFITTPTHLSCCFLFLWRLGRPKLHNSFLMAFALFLFLLCRLQRATCSFLCLPSSRCSPCFSGDSKSQLYSILCLCSSSHSVFFSATPLQLPIFCVYQHHALFFFFSFGRFSRCCCVCSLNFIFIRSSSPVATYFKVTWQVEEWRKQVQERQTTNRKAGPLKQK